ncbi:hypothetical protein DPMN_127523 [Dreissena polymorpha]|uniref:Uncharacterized protein n=1 Tax=Dreissena polymorpha TaxID=45954 RepID=A0A9D4GZD5_DREPO|nr:hypothetical protein DPMN_127523 [Dreissena polymorpha]
MGNTNPTVALAAQLTTTPTLTAADLEPWANSSAVKNQGMAPAEIKHTIYILWIETQVETCNKH